jgi:hypothetical protein
MPFRSKRAAQESTSRYRDTRKSIDAEIHDTRGDKADKLKEVTSWCDRRRAQQLADARAAVKRACDAERDPVKERTAEEIDRLRAERGAAWQQHVRERRGDAPEPYGRAESDQLARHAIPDRLIPAWDRYRAAFSYDRQPDDRAVEFMEWVAENEGQTGGSGNLAVWLDERAQLSAPELEAAEIRHAAELAGLNPGAPLAELYAELMRIDKAAELEGPGLADGDDTSFNVDDFDDPALYGVRR